MGPEQGFNKSPVQVCENKEEAESEDRCKPQLHSLLFNVHMLDSQFPLLVLFVSLTE